MNEENKTQDDGYQEIDVSKPQPEEPEKDYEDSVKRKKLNNQKSKYFGKKKNQLEGN